ncbi:alpha/beta fold hydrolase [Amycolatopsis azurea]|uniref:Alpha/beta hydrolase n=1 Tax=Amycolatopsis azurea DSM 43854 TaxID=1238180 RepID=M2QBQ1_9PSEU|nr:alpha/beta hydrolase [Amycolatopsis azurea]EMD23517.1 putative hydrolase [Amycolatopsis azurea DSM 43854]OOC08504.1 alpha/beta hydrolase [Amycolatopsis azurea DSM 43854]
MVPVVFVHGIRLSGAAWSEQLDLLGPPAKAVDLPGHGSRRGERFTLKGAVDAVVDAIDEPALVVGHSLGGYVATAAAARHPESVAGLVVAGSTYLPDRALEGLFRLAHRILMRLPDRGEGLSRRQFRTVLPRKVAEAVLGGGIATEVIPDVAKALAGFDVLAELGGYPGPAWLINGSRDHFRRHERRFLDACADGRLINVPKAGHYLPMTRGEEFAQLVLDAARSLSISGTGKPGASGGVVR